MTRELLRHLLDACFQAKRITELMPVLPDGMKPRHIHIIDAIYNLKAKNGVVHVSDVSAALQVTAPSVTKLIDELVKTGVVTKSNTLDDRRVILLNLTPLGVQYYKTYVEEYHGRLVDAFQEMNESDCETTVRTVDEFYKQMKIEMEKQRNESK